MDLSTMSAKLESGKYKDRFAFEEDFRLIIVNCKVYNAPGSYAHSEAIALEEFFGKQWVRINKTLEAADKAADQKPVAPQVPAARALPNDATQSTSQPSSILRNDAIISTATPASNTGRPLIKLKVGGSSNAGSLGDLESSSAFVAKTPSKPKGRQPKEPKLATIPPPPIPESAASAAQLSSERDPDQELLEEVIAIERQKNGESRKHRLSVEKEKEKVKEVEKEVHNPKVVIGKRKKIEEEITEDEILALATPAKKLSLPILTGPSSTTPSSPDRDKSSSSSQVHPNDVSHKSREKIPKLHHDFSPQPVVPPPRPSTKGKEREALTTGTTATTPPVVATKLKKQPPRHETPTPMNEKKCRDILKALTKSPDARIFLRPVDPVQDGCPT